MKYIAKKPSKLFNLAKKRSQENMPKVSNRNLKSSFKNLILFASAAIGLANIIAVYKFWKFVKENESLSNNYFNFSEYLAVQSCQNTILQIYLVIISLLFAFLAIYGFSVIKASAEEMAINKAEEISKKMVENFIEENSKKLNLGNASLGYDNNETTENGKSHV